MLYNLAVWTPSFVKYSTIYETFDDIVYVPVAVSPETGSIYNLPSYILIDANCDSVSFKARICDVVKDSTFGNLNLHLI